MYIFKVFFLYSIFIPHLPKNAPKKAGPFWWILKGQKLERNQAQIVSSTLPTPERHIPASWLYSVIQCTMWYPRYCALVSPRWHLHAYAHQLGLPELSQDLPQKEQVVRPCGEVDHNIVNVRHGILAMEPQEDVH